jgi:hypothetical protein
LGNALRRGNLWIVEEKLENRIQFVVKGEGEKREFQESCLISDAIELN